MAQERSIKVWFGRDQFIAEDQFAVFKAEYPDIAVEFEVIRLEDVNAQLVLATRSGNAPDIVQIQARDITQLARGGLLKDFTAQVETWKTTYPDSYAQLSPLAWEGASWADRQVYGVAAMRRVVEGLETPEDAVRDYHDRLKKKGIRPTRSLAEDVEITEAVLK
jgi:ABC-type glycerol-3-phosphate transport system substrate-binding protein